MNDEPDAHVCIYCDNLGEIHLGIFFKENGNEVERIRSAINEALDKIQETINADPRPAPIERLH